ncbi:YkoF family thiamine/hydroxymethylpyrimidine-binding protein [Alkalibacter mobilis]|uniref:YkoF family thiamine/hydroxymethylpyrimidine-binding protein n=1 Tax=Alkalibacter mobilis TaxID=2787712 RepID=UPI0018A0723F|nr:YkoF family thiamine/hydroxymethylpyrimidine-binding protein [Alkalibacter mobilis]MBF7097765.1 thiamine-binding protein [Alkalibacter mobilis]
MDLKCGTSDVVGARIGVYPMQVDFVDVILNAVRATDRSGLAVMTDDLGTTIQGKRDRVFSYVKEVFLRAADAGEHVVANVLFSVGCPGDVPEDFDFNVVVPKASLPIEDMQVACAWSLYPLGNKGYFDVIVEEVQKAINISNLDVASYHYCTRLDGKAKDIFDLLEASFEGVSKRISHTIIHATLSKGSPSESKKNIVL